MSISTVDLILKRIEGAAEDSPIAVFKARGWPGRLNAVFGETIRTRTESVINPDFVGMFHGGMDMNEVRYKLFSSC